MNYHFFHLFLLFALTLTNTSNIHAGKNGKPRCSSFQATSRKKATIYLAHAREFSAYIPKSKQARKHKLLQALDLIDEQFQQQPEAKDFGSIIGNLYFPQSLINCIYDIADGVDFSLDLLKDLVLKEFGLIKSLNIHQTIIIFSAVNHLLVIFFAAILATQKKPSDWHGSIHCFFHTIFEAQKTSVAIPFSMHPRRARSHSA